MFGLEAWILSASCTYRLLRVNSGARLAGAAPRCASIRGTQLSMSESNGDGLSGIAPVNIAKSHDISATAMWGGGG